MRLTSMAALFVALVLSMLALKTSMVRCWQRMGQLNRIEKLPNRRPAKARLSAVCKALRVEGPYTLTIAGLA